MSQSNKIQIPKQSPKAISPETTDDLERDIDGLSGKVERSLPELPGDFAELQMITAVYPTVLFDQAKLLRARYNSFLKAGFTEDQAMQLLLRWGLKTKLTDD
ncbi:hypothetical protein KKF05_00230 [Patescibacteria group bacterium]|nr:hypothetical protein [Patescibacteria group bacterium]MBU1028836.1 hypothetical protein [Patescibacteria group bacterium]MBU1915875.1 hypothetical protein [Patescibacteria group bacterium]